MTTTSPPVTAFEANGATAMSTVRSRRGITGAIAAINVADAGGIVTSPLTPGAAGAAGVAALLDGAAELAGKRVGIIVSGGNIDPNLLGKVLQQGLASAGRYLAFRTWLDDRPGQLHELTGILGGEHINILHVGIDRLGPYTTLGRVGLDVIVDTRDTAHAEEVLALVRRSGFPAEQLLDVQPLA
ncbi:MAG TPA: hypothetical protein DCK98_18320 [Chloroflexi bacterium]|nr:hypothetical protein [Chloroflexota bacterium]